MNQGVRFVLHISQGDLYSAAVYAVGMGEQHERLQYARAKAGYKEAGAAAEAFGWNVNTYRSHENGARGLRPPVAKRYAKAFHVSSAWLLTGEGDTPGKSITLDPADLRAVVALLLEAQGSDAALASELADIVVESLSEPPLATVGRDIVQSFQVRLELQARRYDRPAAR